MHDVRPSVKDEFDLTGRYLISSIEEADDLNSEVGWDVKHRVLDGRRLHSRFKSRGPMSIIFHNNALEVQGMVETATISLLFPLTGEGTLNHVPYKNGNMLFCISEIENCFIAKKGTSILSMTFSKSEFETALRTQIPGSSFEDLIRNQVFRGASAKLAHLKSIATSYLHKENSSQNGCSEAYWMDSIIDQFASYREHVDDLRTPINFARQRSLRRARDFIESHLGFEFRVTDICEYSGAGIRTLQRAFGEEFGMTPVQYVKMRRLTEAYNELLRRDFQETSVTSVATKFGLWHLSRFSSEYHTQFGEYPSETLMSSKRTFG